MTTKLKFSSSVITKKNEKDIKKLLDLGLQRGYLTYQEVNELMPPDLLQPEAIDDIMKLLSDNEIEVNSSKQKATEKDDVIVEEEVSEEVVEVGPEEVVSLVEGEEAVVVGEPAEEGAVEGKEGVVEGAEGTATIAKGADPVKLYLKKMGSVSLLTREGEVEIAKRIEEGEIEILRALLASKLGTLAIVELGERLEIGRTKAKDVIRGVEEEISEDDEKKFLERILNAIAKVKVLLNYQEKNEKKFFGAESKKVSQKEKERIQLEIRRRERSVEKAFESIAFNRKTINILSSKIKEYWKRGKDLLTDQRKIFDKDINRLKDEILKLKNSYSDKTLTNTDKDFRKTVLSFYNSIKEQKDKYDYFWTQLYSEADGTVREQGRDLKSQKKNPLSGCKLTADSEETVKYLFSLLACTEDNGGSRSIASAGKHPSGMDRAIASTQANKWDCSRPVKCPMLVKRGGVYNYERKDSIKLSFECSLKSDERCDTKNLWNCLMDGSFLYYDNAVASQDDNDKHWKGLSQGYWVIKAKD